MNRSDYNICESCDVYVDRSCRDCPECGQPVVVDATKAISLWRLGDIREGVIGPLSAALREKFGVPVVVQPSFLDERPSRREHWNGISANVFLAQALRRHQRGVFVSFGITESNIVPGARWNYLFGFGYMGAPAAIMSLCPLDRDEPELDRRVRRAASIAVHEIGHTLGLDDHDYEMGGDCVMVGDVAFDSIETIDQGGIDFCAGCQRQMNRLPRWKRCRAVVHDAGATVRSVL